MKKYPVIEDDTLDEAMLEARRRLVERDRVLRPLYYIACLQLIPLWLLIEYGGLPEIAEGILSLPSIAFALISWFRFWANLFCPNCHISLFFPKWNRSVGGGLRPSESCRCVHCGLRIPFDEF